MRGGRRRGGVGLRAGWALFLVLIPLLGRPAEAEAQRRGQMGPRSREGMSEAREVLEARLRSFFADAVRTRLGLSDEEMEEVRARFQAFEAERQALAREERELRRSLGPALGGGREALSEAEARDALEQLVELRLEEARLFHREQEALLQVLTPTQVVELYKLREAMMNRIQRMRRGPPGGPPGPGGGPPPPPPR